MRAAFCAVALLALACLLIRASRVGLAGDYVDPIGKITAQDEALYSHSAIRITQGGGWLTPRFMGRFALYKPPLQLWASALSSRVFGISRVALRLPVAILCALAAGCVFLWAAEVRAWPAGASAAILVMSNHLWHVLGGMNITDGYLAAFCTLALYCLFSNPWLESRGALLGFAASVAAAILTKSIAGLLPLGVLAVYWVAAPRKHRPSLRRVLFASALSIGLAAPWFIYQMAAHGRWFWAEHVGVEILGYGAGAPPQTSLENPLVFHLLRAAAIDPVLFALAVLSLPGLVRAFRQRSAEAVLLASWLGVLLSAVVLWKYRNVSYLLPLVPAAAILVAVHSPLAGWWRGFGMPALAVIALLAKAAMPSSPSGISFASGNIQPHAASLSQYCEMARGNELIVAGLDDDLYAAVLPLSRVRYLLVGVPRLESGPYRMPFADMGIAVTAAQFSDLPRYQPVFMERLRAWGLDSAEPIGTLILAAGDEDLRRVIDTHPASDFFLPHEFRRLGESTHETVPAGDHILLLSRMPAPRESPPAWPCRL
jgi:hypothetical protein